MGERLYVKPGPCNIETALGRVVADHLDKSGPPVKTVKELEATLVDPDPMRPGRVERYGATRHLDDRIGGRVKSCLVFYRNRHNGCFGEVRDATLKTECSY